MKEFKKASWKEWLAVAGLSLLLHYLMLVLAHILLTGSFSFSGMWQLMMDRLTQPGDAVRYLDIAQNGYVTQGENAINLVFYPLYPLLIRLFSCLGGDMGVIGMFISQICFAGAAVFLYELIRLDGDKRMAWDGVLLLNLYPFSMFAMGVFTEGLFLFLTIACMYAIRKHQFLWAGIAGFLAALTRVQGMLLIFPAVYEWITHCFGKEKHRPKWKDVFLLLIPGGFAVYLFINYFLHGDFLKFLEFEAGEPWYQTSQWIGKNIAQHYQMAQDYSGLSLTIYWVQAALFFICLGVLMYGLFKKERVSYLLYGGAYLGFTYLSGWMISGGRYMLGCFPVMMILSKMKDDWPRRLLLMGAGMLFFAYSLFYLMGYAIM